MKYYIDYNTGAGNEAVEKTLEETMRIADEGAAYTQQDIVISDEDGNEVARRVWYGTSDSSTESDPIRFGDAGFYADWHGSDVNDNV